MLKLYGARENRDKERFIYDNVSGEALVLVPNQYTLVAEEQALKYTGGKCLYNIEILSMNRLGLRVLTEKGLESTKMLDKYGRFMLLTRIIREHRDELEIYAKSVGKVTFTSMLNDFISQFKQQDCTMEELGAMLDSDDADVLLKAKLKELLGIIEEYEEAIEGRYTDSEDYVSMYVEAMGDSSLVRDKEIWIYGYDNVTPKFMSAMMELAGSSRGVNFIVNESDFSLDASLVAGLREEAKLRGVEFSYTPIGAEYDLEKSETIARIERGLWNDYLAPSEIEDNRRFVPDDLTIVKAANPYFEAESAAAYIYHLVRDLGYRFSDIQVIANDEGTMQPIIRRCFEEYGLTLFLDQSRSIKDSSAAAFIINMLSFLRYREGTNSILSMLKTELAGVTREDVEELENYARTYRIKGSMWLKPFKYGEKELGPEKFERIEQLRAAVTEPLEELAKLSAGGTVAEFITGFKKYLQDRWQLEERVIAAADAQDKMNYHEEAQRSVQSYVTALELLDQMVEIMGDEALDFVEFYEVFLQGLGNVEIGVIPQASDALSLGTMIRTRPRPAKAVVVLGANEGTLPLQPSPEGLFSIDEKAYFKNRGFALGGLDDLKMEEENVAMYRMLSKPSEKLYISYSLTDADGAEAAPSPVIDALVELFPAISSNNLIRDDIVSAGWHKTDSLNDLISSKTETMRHLINHLKDKNSPEKMDSITQALLKWFEENDEETIRTMLTAAQDENDPKALGVKTAVDLYSRRDGSVGLSASSIQSYYECPFKYYIDKGLRPQEERLFASDPRSIGDVYHECMMIMAEKIMADKSYGKKLTECTTTELEDIVSLELEQIAGNYNGGLFISSENEEYRLDRIQEVCAGAVRAMARQLSVEWVSEADFEEGFGRGRRFKPIEIEVEGQKVYVEGKIDRADVLEDPETGTKRVRIIDYKTGSDSLNEWNMRHGYKMQLMIYMISASGDYEPAGLFYFNIKDALQSFNGKDENELDKNTGKLKGELETADQLKLKGRYIDEPGVLEQMPASELHNAKDKLSFESFNELKDDVTARVNEIAEGIVKGRIEIRPLKYSKKLVCGYCKYKSICRRDREYVMNRAREIPADPKKS